MSRVDVDVQSLERLRASLATYASSQQEAIGGLSAEIERCEDQVVQRVDEARARFQASSRALADCESYVGPEGERNDCSGPYRAFEAARDQFYAAERALGRLQRARSQWESSARAHERVLAAQVPGMRTGLERRIASLEGYNAWSLETLHVAGLVKGVLAPRPDFEAQEGGRGGKEQLW